MKQRKKNIDSMERKKIEGILYDYAESLPKDRERDLQRFRADAVKRPARPWRRQAYAVATVCLFAVILCGGILRFAPSVSSPPPTDVMHTPTDAPTDGGEASSAPAPQRHVLLMSQALDPSDFVLYDAVYDNPYSDNGDVYYVICGGSSSTEGVDTNMRYYIFKPDTDEKYHFLGNVPTPTLANSRLWLGDLKDPERENARIGVSIHLQNPAVQGLTDIKAYYVADAYDVVELQGYQGLECQADWKGMQIRYREEKTDTGFLYFLYVEGEKSYGCLEIAAKEQWQIVDLLKTVFE